MEIFLKAVSFLPFSSSAILCSWQSIRHQGTFNPALAIQPRAALVSSLHLLRQPGSMHGAPAAIAGMGIHVPQDKETVPDVTSTLGNTPTENL